MSSSSSSVSKLEQHASLHRPVMARAPSARTHGLFLFQCAFAKDVFVQDVGDSRV